MIRAENYLKHLKFETELNDLVIICAFFVLILLPIEFFMDLMPIQRQFLEIIDFSILTVFAFEIVYKVLHAKKKRKYLRTHWLDVLAVLPFLKVFKLGRVAEVGRLGELEKVVKLDELLKAEKLDELGKVLKPLHTEKFLHKVEEEVKNEREKTKKKD